MAFCVSVSKEEILQLISTNRPKTWHVCRAWGYAALKQASKYTQLLHFMHCKSSITKPDAENGGVVHTEDAGI